MKHITIILCSFILSFFSFINKGNAQTFLNGDFEIHTAVTDQINLSNAAFNAIMANTVAYGSFGDMDIVTSATYCGLAQNGSWYTALTGTSTDAITMQLSAPLVAGTSYTISFWDRGCWPSFSASAPAVQIGVSNTAGTTGTAVYTAPLPTNGVWVQRTATFVAPISGLYISVILPLGGLGDWTQIDNFTFVTTAAPPVSNFTASTNTICAGNCIAFTDASTNTPTSWSWTFAGGTPATSTSQNPASVCYAAAGTYAVTLTATNASGSNTLTQTNYITVNPIDNASFNYSAASYCISGPNPTPTITGTVGGTFTSTAGLSITPGTGTINLAGSTPGTYTVTYTTSGVCPATSIASVTISTAPTAAFSYAGPYCQSAADPSPTIGAGSTAGTFTSTAGLSINSSSGLVDLSLSTPGTYTVTNSVAASGSCPAASATATITINAIDDASFNYSAASYCISGTDPTPTITGTAGGTFTSTAGLPITSGTGTINLAGSIAGTYTVTYTTSGACPATSTASLTISTPSSASFSYAGPYCQSAADPSPTLGAGASAGTFTSTAGLSINATSGLIDLSLSTAGTYTVTNTVAASGGCPSDSSTATITINSDDIASFNYSSASYCQSATDPIPTITGTPGGTFTSSGGLSINPTTGTINLAASAPGSYTVTYTTAGPCTATATTPVTIVSAPVATFSYAGPYCQNAADPSPSLGTGATSGTYTSTAGLTINSSTGVVDLSASTPGTYTVTNSVAGSAGCPASSSTFTITINAVPVPAISGITTICNGATTSLTATGGTTYNWNTGSASATTSVSPTVTTTYTVTANNGGCTATATQTVTVTPSPTGTVNPQICAGQNYTLPSGVIVSNAGTYSDTVSTSGGCDSIIITNLTVNTASANAGIDTIISYGTSTVLGASGGVSYSWSPSNGLSCTACANPTASPLETTSYVVTATNSNGCTASDTITVFVELPECSGTFIDLKTLIPNAFSPNEDGLNDLLCVPENPCIERIDLIIYDRWGEKVYEGSIDKCWDGIYKGKKLDSAVFAYYFTVVFIDGKKGNGKGNISLIK